MPTKYTKRTARKRVYKRKPRKAVKPYRRVRRNFLPIGGFSNSHLCRLRYVENITFNPTAGTISINVFRANSVFDPNSTGGGHQPSNFDRWAENYDRYTVFGSKCTVQPFQTAASGVVPGLIVLHVSEDGSALNGAHATGGTQAILEQPRLSWSSRSYGANVNGGALTLTRKFSAKRFFKSKNIVGTSPYSADIAANPTEQAFFEVAVMSVDDTNDPGQIKTRVIIDYVVLFTEPKAPKYS